MKYMLRAMFVFFAASALVAQEVTTSKELVAAVRDRAEGSVILVGPGMFRLDAPLEPKTGMTLKGAGQEETILTHTAHWKPSTKALPRGEMRPDEADSSAYLIRLQDRAENITIADLTLRGPHMHGAIFGVRNKNVHLHHLRIHNVLYSGIRTYFMKGGRIHDCEFIGAGGRWKRGGIPGTDGGISGGAIFATWMSDTEITNNRFSYGKPDRRPGRAVGHYGIKGRGGRNIHIHHNTIGVNFSIEFPFDGNEGMEIDHNILRGVVSIPKHGGNLISGFFGVASPGPAWFHNNLVSNPGRGVIWNERAFTELVIRNNHIITRTTVTPRKEGLFAIGGTDFSKTRILDNIIECRGQSRPLLRNKASYNAEIRNNRLSNVSDSDAYRNPTTGAKRGPEEPLKFKCGAHGEMTVDGWAVHATDKRDEDDVITPRPR